MNKNLLKKIVITGYTLFKEKGYKETTVMDICEACQITKTTFYRYVNSKEDLLAYFFDDITDDLGQLVVWIAQSSDYVDGILKAFDLIVNQMERFGQDLYTQLYISNLSGNNSSFEEIPVHKELVLALIRKAQETNQIKNQNSAEDIYENCRKLCFGVGILWCLHKVEDVHSELEKEIKITLQV